MQSENNKEAIKDAFRDKYAVLKEKMEKGEEITSADRIKVAVLADSPTVTTGFGKVCYEILMSLHKTGMYDFEIVGINYDGSPHDLPFKIYPAINAMVRHPAYQEPYGRQRFLDMIGEGRFDLVWVLQDSFIVSDELAERIQETSQVMPVGKQFSYIFYFPVDATLRKDWIDKSALIADFPVVYTQYGYNEVMKLYEVDDDSLLKPEEKEKNIKDGETMHNKLTVIYHGSNLKDFFPKSEEDRQALKAKFWGEKKDKFVFINVNRNQPRKDMFRTLQAFKILLDRRRAKGKDDVYLYMHCNIFDDGMNLIDMSSQIKLTQGDEWAHPDPARFNTSHGFPVSMINDLYNASDAVVSTTLGEGWGLSITEGMAVGLPVIAPDHTSISEILGKTESGTAERGFLVKTKGCFVQQNDNARIRPITDPEDLADKMEFVLENRPIIQPIVDSALAWVKEYAWDGKMVGKAWQEVFANAYQYMLYKRSVEFDNEIAKKLALQKIGRNDECPACKTKYKHCRHFQIAQSMGMK